MKIYTNLIGCIFFLLGCSNQQPSTFEKTHSNSSTTKKTTDINKAYLHFTNGNICNFGTVQEKIDTILMDVKIENSGRTPLLIYKADVSCGCVSVKIPKEPILPKKNAVIHIKVNTIDQNGYFSKAIFLNSNASNDVEILHIKGTIKN